VYLHLGNDVIVNMNNVIGIFDMDNTTVSHQTRGFLAMAQKNGSVTDTTEDLPKSFVVAREKGETKVYISSLASRTLLKRVKSGKIII